MNSIRTLLNVIVVSILTFLPGCTVPFDREAKKPAEMVNPLMGTDSDYRLSHGNTYPAVAMPWGMNFWTPQTGRMGNGWIYTYDATKINGIKQTHQPSPWINDYAAFALMAVTGKEAYREEERASWFSHKAEKAKPYYYSVYLADYDVTVEVTPTTRAAIFRFTFPESDSSYIILDAFNMGSGVKIIPGERKITGYCRNNHGGVPENFTNWFVAVFDRDFDSYATWRNDTLRRDSLSAEGEHSGALVRFKTKRGDKINVRVASSFISAEQAMLNLEREICGKDFEQVKEECRSEWNRQLGKITVEGGTDDQIRTFYSCLYRMLLFPRDLHEINDKNEKVHYSPYNGEVLPGEMFTDNGFWDTFRAQFPFLTLVFPGLNGRIMNGLVNTYLESGWLPEWAPPPASAAAAKHAH